MPVNGKAERFNGTVLDEFSRTSLREAAFDRLGDPQAGLDAWLVHHDHERPHRGCRHRGRRPIAAVDQAPPIAGHEGW